MKSACEINSVQTIFFMAQVYKRFDLSLKQKRLFTKRAFGKYFMNLFD
jgi:hypothetical protein